MAVTRSRSVERAAARTLPGQRQRPAWRSRELVLTLAASLLVAAGLYQVHKAKTQGLAEIDAGLTAKRLLNLNALGGRVELTPARPVLPQSSERDAAARKRHSRQPRTRAARPQDAHRRTISPVEAVAGGAAAGAVWRAFYLWCGIFFGAFWIVHVYRSRLSGRPDVSAMLMVLGIGLILMVSLRDPVRDNPLFRGFRAGRGGGRGAIGRSAVAISASPAS
jgi:hypothetical protein